MLRDYALKYYDTSYDYNCSETILYAANEAYNLQLSEDSFKIMAAFGGGLAVEDICGALTGAAAVIGILYTDNRAHVSPRVKLLTQELVAGFKDRLKGYNCKVLKEEYKTEDKRCSEMIIAAADALEEIIEKEGVR